VPRRNATEECDPRSGLTGLPPPPTWLTTPPRTNPKGVPARDTIRRGAPGPPSEDDGGRREPPTGRVPPAEGRIRRFPARRNQEPPASKIAREAKQQIPPQRWSWGWSPVPERGLKMFTTLLVPGPMTQAAPSPSRPGTVTRWSRGRGPAAASTRWGPGCVRLDRRERRLRLSPAWQLPCPPTFEDVPGPGPRPGLKNVRAIGRGPLVLFTDQTDSIKSRLEKGVRSILTAGSSP